MARANRPRSASAHGRQHGGLSALDRSQASCSRQLCDIVDLDGPYFLADRADQGIYRDWRDLRARRVSGAPRRVRRRSHALQQLPHPYLLFIGNVTERGYAKTALGLADWVPERCVGEFVTAHGRRLCGSPSAHSRRRHAQGGARPRHRRRQPRRRARSRMDARAGSGARSRARLVSGLHMRLGDESPNSPPPRATHGRRLIDIRTPPAGLPVATGRKRTGRRLLTVGTDCALGKKYTALALARAFQAHGVPATFRATGQTGILIAGEGMPIDSVVADFIAGAAEQLSPTPHRIIGTSSRARVRSSTRATRASRSACFMAANPMSSSSATSRAAHICSACPISRRRASPRRSNSRSCTRGASTLPCAAAAPRSTPLTSRAKTPTPSARRPPPGSASPPPTPSGAAPLSSNSSDLASPDPSARCACAHLKVARGLAYAGQNESGRCPAGGSCILTP